MITEIPLNKLAPFAGNVRKTENKAFIEELAASIGAHGLQQNLIVKKRGGKYEVVAGGQRLSALLLLQKRGDIAAGYLVPCKVHEGGLDPAEISLAENVMRDDMHPADQYEAFRDLADKGAPAADIAARFGKSEAHVSKLLKLARVSPVILVAYREDKLTLEQVMAFAVTDDHKAHDAVFGNLRAHSRDPRGIRAALTQGEIPSTDRRALYVTVDAYAEAGGPTRLDLFTGTVYLLDKGLLGRLAAAKLERSAERVAKEGWKWTEAHIDFGYDQKSAFHQMRPEALPLPKKLAAKLEKLEAEHAELDRQWQEADEEAEYPERLDELENEIRDIGNAREYAWTKDQLGMAGAVVTIGDDGKTAILRGLVKAEDMPKRNAKPSPKNGADAGADNGKQPSGLSAALVESLTAQRSAALAAALLDRPDIALVAVVHAFASRVLFQSDADDHALQITLQPQPLKLAEGTKAVARMDAEREAWGKTLSEGGDLWAWCLRQDRETLLKLLAFCAATSVDAVRSKQDRPECDRLRNADALASALSLDMKEWFAADAGNYFSRVSKPQILDALKEARNQPPAPAWEKMKKGELAALAERELAGKGWLPELLRPAA